MTIDAKCGIEHKFDLRVFPALYEGIPVNEPLGIEDVCIVAINDANMNQKPDNGELIGFYWSYNWMDFFLGKWDLTDGENELNKSIYFNELLNLFVNF